MSFIENNGIIADGFVFRSKIWHTGIYTAKALNVINIAIRATGYAMWKKQLTSNPLFFPAMGNLTGHERDKAFRAPDGEVIFLEDLHWNTDYGRFGLNKVGQAIKDLMSSMDDLINFGRDIVVTYEEAMTVADKLNGINLKLFTKRHGPHIEEMIGKPYDPLKSMQNKMMIDSLEKSVIKYRKALRNCSTFNPMTAELIEFTKEIQKLQQDYINYEYNLD